MSQFEKLLQKILSGQQDADISFSELCEVLVKLGFIYRVKGDHFIFTKPHVEEIVNIQPRNGKAKPYQVKQVRNVILRYRLGGEFGE